ncbi:protein REGULATOR OF FATTY ACID COMPOSITION 3, chloroplastic [Elaeis guineensis]|uniref:Uncharacterized protein LOC105039976 n=1 Tax=Elaeis guineensis var. tenera TaxID=51953 RepID=A0A6I9QT02_ELAGV|nr:uncharacterized protein LOC105039976 [Elaeis guineensis]
MEAVSLASSSSNSSRSLLRTLVFQCPQRLRLTHWWSLPSNGFSYQEKLSTERGRLVVAGAKKRKEKPDSHSFVPKPDEATGPFPEAILLQKKTIKEDGRVLPEFADAEEEKLYEFLKLQLESDLNVERVRHYEVVYLIHEDHVDEVESVISKVQDFIRERKGRIWRLNNWGLRRLAYKIRKAKNANYILMNFELEAKLINDFKSMLDKDERIIRHLVIKRDEAITEDCPPPPEYHTIRAQQGMLDEEYEDDEFDGEGEDWDDEGELEVAGDADSDDVDEGDNIIIVGKDDKDDRNDGVSRKAKTLKAEKIAR